MHGGVKANIIKGESPRKNMLGQVVFNCIKISACDIVSWRNDKTCKWLGKQFVEVSADKSYWKISASEEQNCLMIIGVDA